MIKEFFDWLRTTSPDKQKKAVGLLGLGVLVLLGAAISITVILRAQRETVDIKPVTELVQPIESHEVLYEINQVSMAVMNKKGTKTAYAQFSLVLHCPSEEAKKNLTMNRAKVLDAIFVVGGNFYLDDFQGESAAASFDKFKKQLLEKYKADFNSDAPTQIALKDWVIQ